MTNSSYRSRFLVHFLVPVIAATALLALLLTASFSRQLEQAFESRGQAASRQLAELARLALGDDTLSMEEAVKLMLDERAVRSVSLFGPNQRLLAHAGPRSLTAGSALLFDLQPHQVEDDRTTLFITPVSEPSSSRPLAWVAVEMAHDN